MLHGDRQIGIPSMRLAVTGRCNLQCPYCPTDGDSYRLRSASRLQEDDFRTVARVAYEEGFRHFSITGGEPLLLSGITFAVAKELRAKGGLGYLRLNTNGYLLGQHSEEIKEHFDKVKVSMDYPDGTKLDSRQTRVATEDLKRLSQSGVSIRINTVVGRFNLDSVYEMISYCEKNRFELKLFDLTSYRDTLSGDSGFWSRNYVSLLPLADELEKEFGKPHIVYAVGGYGNPMPAFKPDSESPIRLRISETSAMYSQDCTSCRDYLCQDGFCNVTIAADGSIKPCRPEGLDFMPSLMGKYGRLVPEGRIAETLQRTIVLFKSARRKEKTLEEMIESWKRK